METSGLVMAALTYAGSMVLHQVADKAIEDAYLRLVDFVKAKLGRAFVSPHEAADILGDRQVEAGVLTDALALYSRSAALRRARLVAPALQGARLLWVDDNPQHNEYEQAMCEALGIEVDIACSTLDALWRVGHHPYDLLVSDMAREETPDAGLQLLQRLRETGWGVPVVYYIGQLDPARGIPPGAAGITDRPDELLHLVCDVLERLRL